jgi:hypothetical protein
MPRCNAVSAVLLLLAACEPEPSSDDSGGSTTEAPSTDPRATFQAKVDTIELCGFEGAQSVTLLARQVGCEQGPPAPCTIAVDPYMEWSGDLITCPSSQTLLDMDVSVPVAGRFQIEARTLTASGHQSLCFGRDGDVPTVLTTAELEARAQIYVVQTAKTCPTP